MFRSAPFLFRCARGVARPRHLGPADARGEGAGERERSVRHPLPRPRLSFMGQAGRRNSLGLCSVNQLPETLGSQSQDSQPSVISCLHDPTASCHSAAEPACAAPLPS